MAAAKGTHLPEISFLTEPIFSILTQRRCEYQVIEGGDIPIFPVVAIGASSGGLKAFRELFDNLPADTGLAYVLIPHLHPEDESMLAEILARSGHIPIDQIHGDTRLEVNHAYVIHPDTTITISKDWIKVSHRNLPPGKLHVSIDLFMISLAREYEEKAIGVILSGSMSDGSVGIETIKANGGVTFAQDASAKSHDMPKNAIATGCVDFVLSPKGIAEELARIGRSLS